MSLSFETILDRDEGQISVVVEYEHTKACRGHRDKYGVPEEPDSPAMVEIIDLLDIHGHHVPTTKSEDERLEELAMEDANSRYEEEEIERNQNRFGEP